MTEELRFCTSCQCMRSLEGGEFRKTRKSGRWICKPCVERKSASIYKSHTPTTPAELERMRRMLFRRAA